MSNKKLNVIGELINNSYGRARRAFTDKNLQGYQELAKIQTNLGADYLTLNIDGTQHITVKMDEMLSFLPELIPAIQEVTHLPKLEENQY
jgi:5-methyltetrahydrofolate--homocysteine methyltransferase